MHKISLANHDSLSFFLRHITNLLDENNFTYDDKKQFTITLCYLQLTELSSFVRLNIQTNSCQLKHSNEITVDKCRDRHYISSELRRNRINKEANIYILHIHINIYSFLALYPDVD